MFLQSVDSCGVVNCSTAASQHIHGIFHWKAIVVQLTQQDKFCSVGAVVRSQLLYKFCSLMC